MQKNPVRSKLVDKLHKGFVWTCVGVTAYALSEIGWHYYQYFTQVKPNLDQKKLAEKQELLAEGIATDSAPYLTS